MRSRISIRAPWGKSVVTRASSTHGIASSCALAASVSTRSTGVAVELLDDRVDRRRVGVDGAFHVRRPRWRTGPSRAPPGRPTMATTKTTISDPLQALAALRPLHGDAALAQTRLDARRGGGRLDA